MQKQNEIPWEDLQNAYENHLKLLQASIHNVHNSTVDMNQIYEQVIQKAKNSDPETLKRFAQIWMKGLDFQRIESFSSLEEKHKKLVTNPTYDTFKDFGRELQESVYNKSIASLDAYRTTMGVFYSTWKELWPN